MKTVLNKKNYDFTNQPMFLGEDLGIQRYDKFRYPKFYELFLQQKENFWMPFEIGLANDRVQYERLTNEEKFVFESNLRWQTATDSLLSRSIHQMTKYMSSTELELCCGTWADMENVHSLSYTWILQNITKDAGRFFDSILEDKYIVERMEKISNAYDKLLGDSKNIKQEIFDAVLSTQVTEGLSFYVSFACSFYFGYRGKMVGNADIIKLIHRDEATHVAITQNIMKYWRDNKNEGFQDVIKQNEQKVYDVYGQAVQNEKDWAKHLFSIGSLIGLNEQMLGGYIEWLANSRLVSMGYKKMFDQKVNPLSGWLDQYLDESKTQVAPQEKEITSYKIAAFDSTIDEGRISLLEL
jgi:ribonucleoside-diphosphate reductase beta chain